ncbi:RNA polymerase sigma factor [Leekyejoonella antrihumi]|uniref:RNA polymerase sigma factor n=1 Tax=Leekyejoonella antrihumi TaxID=1660198 RepID=UPI001645243D|nr:sigma-70 family RNA polymerase sigma factor [Leekyejoonella antrihumi]
MTGSGRELGSDQAQAAFERLYRDSYGGLMAIAMATVRERTLAEDMVHDAYAQLWRHWASVTYPLAWVRRAVVTNCLDTLRTQRRRDAILRRQPRPTESVTDSSDSAFLDLLVGLNDRQRVALTLKYVEDLSEADIAAALGCRPGTVKSTLHRAIAALRTNLEGERS